MFCKAYIFIKFKFAGCLRGRPGNRWQDEVRENGRIVGGEGWQEKLYNKEEWKKLLRMARNHCIVHMAIEQMNVLCIEACLLSDRSRKTAMENYLALLDSAA
jgi:hypothetical protein